MTTNKIDLSKVIGTVRSAAKAGATEGAMALHAMAIPKTPMRSGDLRNSSAISPVIATTKGYESTVFYTMVYAVYQHEKQYSHYTTAGTGPKFLEEPMNSPELAAKIQQIIANHMKGRL